jgi:AraC family transcriptional regulator
LLDRLVLTKEVWAAALIGGPIPAMDSPAADRTAAALRARFEKADRDFGGIIGDVGKRGAWSDTFVDALCESPETFTFCGMFAHVITFNTHRRLVALEAMRRLGVKWRASAIRSSTSAASQDTKNPNRSTVDYSSRSATAGSIRSARRVGT